MPVEALWLPSCSALAQSRACSQHDWRRCFAEWVDEHIFHLHADDQESGSHKTFFVFSLFCKQIIVKHGATQLPVVELSPL